MHIAQCTIHSENHVSQQIDIIIFKLPVKRRLANCIGFGAYNCLPTFYSNL